MVNDDLGALADAALRVRTKCATPRTMFVYQILNDNPTMSDGVALFHSSHGNLTTVRVAHRHFRL